MNIERQQTKEAMKEKVTKYGGTNKLNFKIHLQIHIPQKIEFILQ